MHAVECYVNIINISSYEKSKIMVWNVGEKNPEFVSDLDAFTSLLLSKQPE